MYEPETCIYDPQSYVNYLVFLALTRGTLNNIQKDKIINNVNIIYDYLSKYEYNIDKKVITESDKEDIERLKNISATPNIFIYKSQEEFINSNIKCGELISSRILERRLAHTFGQAMISENFDRNILRSRLEDYGSVFNIINMLIQIYKEFNIIDIEETYSIYTHKYMAVYPIMADLVDSSFYKAYCRLLISGLWFYRLEKNNVYIVFTE